MSLISTVTNAVDKLIHPKLSAEELGKETVPQLKARAKALKIEGADGMKKAELIAALAASETPDAEKPKTPYQDHMAGWKSKAKKAKEKKSSQADLDFQSHPKFHKFKGTAQGAE